jgi:hypothetical protein
MPTSPAGDVSFVQSMDSWGSQDAEANLIWVRGMQSFMKAPPAAEHCRRHSQAPQTSMYGAFQ